MYPGTSARLQDQVDKNRQGRRFVARKKGVNVWARCGEKLVIPGTTQPFRENTIQFCTHPCFVGGVVFGVDVAPGGACSWRGPKRRRRSRGCRVAVATIKNRVRRGDFSVLSVPLGGKPAEHFELHRGNARWSVPGEWEARGWRKLGGRPPEAHDATSEVE